MSSARATEDDFIIIQAQCISYFNIKYQCDLRREEMKKPLFERLAKIKSRGASPEALKIEKEKQLKVIQKDLTKCQTSAHIFNGVLYKKCPCQFSHPLFNQIVALSKASDKGFLPFEGAYMDQPNQIMELIQIYESLKSREEYESDKIRQKIEEEKAKQSAKKR